MGFLPAITRADDLLFGRCLRPLTCGHGLEIGAGMVYPEINFTLPPMEISEATWPAVKAQYHQMIEEVAKRAVELRAPAIVVEFELLPPMTFRPEWGAEITAILRKALDHWHETEGLRSALRVTPTDIRDNERPPRMRTGDLCRTMLKSFELCAGEGADLLSIESTGGKEIHDEALLHADLAGIVFALGLLAPRDMTFLWERIVQIAEKGGSIAAGDTACGFANTAMVLADRGMLPRVLAAVVRVASTVRSLQAYLVGARGPSKDCAYEGPFLKAMVGVPISLEGKSSACAHLSCLGNIASAACDLWSNESVQNVKLLSATAPVVSMEQLIYDCRLMNQALADGNDEALRLRGWMVKSDASLDPQAHILRPEVVVDLAERMAACDTPLAMTLCAVRETLNVLRHADTQGLLHLAPQEKRYLDLLDAQAETLPDDENALLGMVLPTLSPGKVLLEEYGFPSLTPIQLANSA